MQIDPGQSQNTTLPASPIPLSGQARLPIPPAVTRCSRRKRKRSERLQEADPSIRYRLSLACPVTSPAARTLQEPPPGTSAHAPPCHPWARSHCASLHAPAATPWLPSVRLVTLFCSSRHPACSSPCCTPGPHSAVAGSCCLFTHARPQPGIPPLDTHSTCVAGWTPCHIYT